MAKNLAPPTLESFHWGDDGCEPSLASLHLQLVSDARAAADWYAGRRRPKKIGGLWMRTGAIVLLAAAGLLPIISAALPEERQINALWASLGVGLAALLVALDRFIGWSSGWIRYITTEMAIRGALRDFELEWQVHRAAWRGQPPTAEQVAVILALGRTFAARVHTLVAEETAAWASEFQANLNQIDEAVKAAEVEQRAIRAASEAGALNVVVSNRAQIDGPWHLSVDGGTEKVYLGPSASIARLPPGPHHVRIRGIVGGAERASELSADVPPGATTTAEIAL